MIKQRKNGTYSLKLEEELWNVIRLALRSRLHFESEDLQVFIWCLLESILTKLEERVTGTICLRDYELFALFDEATMKYLDETTQIILNNELNPLRKNLFHHKTV